jgi:hypothetical protein
MFPLFFRRILQACFFNVAYVFTHMLQVFYLDVIYVCNDFKCFLTIFASVSSACFKCFICLFYMLQVLHQNISKVDRILHLGYAWELEGARAVPAGT